MISHLPHQNTQKNSVLAKQSTTANKWSCKEVANRVITPSVVRKRNTMLSCISGNHIDFETNNTISFIINIIYYSLFFFISLTFAVTKDPTLIFILTRFGFFLSFIIVSKVKLIIDLGWWWRLSIIVAIRNHTVELFCMCVKSHSYKNQKQKKRLGVEKE